jgi:hypothetical protein|tara:strand:+ start:1683 stop:1907 length:225 start_codon:yes stop_codon:yes gene_type:complete
MPNQEEILKQSRIKYQVLFNSKEGQDVMADLENRCAYHVSTFSKDANEMAFLEGQRAVLLFIKSMLKPIPKEKK